MAQRAEDIVIAPGYEEVRSIRAHQVGLIGVALSADGRTIATTSSDSTIRLWNFASGEMIRSLQGRHEWVAGATFSPDGQWLAAASADHDIILWAVPDMREAAVLRGHSGIVAGLAFSPDSRTLASASHDKSVGLWDISTGRQIRSLGGHADAVEGVAFSPDGRRLATASRDRTVRLWDVASGVEGSKFQGHDDWVMRVRFSPDGTRLASASYDRKVRVWDLLTNRQARSIGGHARWVNDVMYLSGGFWLASASWDGSVRVWDANSGRDLEVLARPPFAVAGIAQSPDGISLITASADGTVRIWESLRARIIAMRPELREQIRPRGKLESSAGYKARIDSALPIIDRVLAARALRSDSIPSPQRAVATLASGPSKVSDAKSVQSLGMASPRLRVDGIRVEDSQGRPQVRVEQIVTITVRVRNDGDGAADEVRATVSAGPTVFLVDTVSNRRVVRELGRIPAGGFIDFEIRAFANAQSAQRFPLTVSLSERTGRYAMADADLGLTVEAPSQRVAQSPLAVSGGYVAGSVGSTPPGNPLAGMPSDLLRNVPSASVQNPNAIAVIIGNRTYRTAPAVAYATNDAAVMRMYAEQTLGIRPGNIFLLEDATLSDLKRLFGDRGNPNGRLSDLVKPGVSDVFVFYSGHGAPDVRERQAYLMPVDADPGALALTGISLDVLYENLAALKARHVTVVLDACFSGATGGGEMLITAASPIGISVRDPAARFATGGATIVAAAQGQELANWYPDQRHGLLTYFFLKGLQGGADVDHDGKVSVGEIRQWLTDPLNGVPYESRRLFGSSRQQTPVVWGEDARWLRP